MTCKGYFYSVSVLDLYQLMSPCSFRYQALWHSSSSLAEYFVYAWF